MPHEALAPQAGRLWLPARIEGFAASLALALMAVLPIAEIVWRAMFKAGIPGSGSFVQHLTLWVGFLGAAIAAREGRLLALATGTMIPEGPWRRVAGIVAAAVAAAVSTLLCRSAIGLVLV